MAASAPAADQALLPTVGRDEIVASTGKKKAAVVAVCGEERAFHHAHLPHAVSYDAVVAGTAKLPKDHGTLIVLYSDDAGRARLPQAIADLRARGYTNLRRFSGGLRGWKEKGGGVESDESTSESPTPDDKPKGKE